MTDNELIEATARFWIKHGGDSEGITWVWKKLQDKIKELEENHDRTTSN